MASPRTNKLRKRASEAPWKSIREASARPLKEPIAARIAYRQAFEGTPDVKAFASTVGLDSQILGFALTRWEASRREAVASDTALLPAAGWKVAGVIPAADIALSHLDAKWPWIEGFVGTKEWPDDLRENLDATVGVLLKLRQGLTPAAVVGARHLIERWTFNVVSSHGLDWKGANEKDAAFITRAWSHYGLSELGRNPGEDWSMLSELQHGRDVNVGSRRVNLLSTGPDQKALHAEITRIIEIPLRQIRGSILPLMEDEAATHLRPHLLVPAFAFKAGTFDEPEDICSLVAPPEFFTLATSAARTAIAKSEAYRRMTARVDLSQPLRGPTRTDVYSAVRERIARIFQNASIAFREERDMTGDRFEFGDLAARLFRYGAFTALAEIAAETSSTEAARAIRLAGRALTSAWNLWLEDSDLSLAAVRIVAEQTAIFRAFRLKPVRAQKLMQRPELPASRWFDLAGWGRLSAYTRALGEFSHMHLTSRRIGARRVLTDIQGLVDPVEAPHGARREALDEAAYMLAYEIAAHLEDKHADLAEAFREGVTLLSRSSHELRLESWLRRAENFRGSNFGDADAHLAVEKSDHVSKGAAESHRVSLTKS